MTEAREARRRRIMDRGSDRLAFITGQIRSVPPSESPSPPQLDNDVILLAKDESNDSIKPTLSSESTRSAPNIFSRSVITKHDRYNASDLIEELPRSSLPDDRFDGTEKLAKTPAPSSRSVGNDDNKVDMTRNSAPTTSCPKFTLKRLSSCISSSENVRLLCATLIACLVILPYHGYNLGNQVTASLITLKPLYLVLLTDATIVLLKLLVNDKPEGNNCTPQTDCGGFDLARALELGLIMGKVIKAAFTDCSICALVMIIGIPLGSNGVI